MEKLIKPSEYAKELGISRQAVYAKIKRGILKAKEVDGQLYIMLSDSDTTPQKSSKSTTKTTIQKKDTPLEYSELLKAKDETIAVLKDTIKDLKESNREISTTLRGEIDLLKEAFYEMRNLYSHQLEYQKPKERENLEAIDDDSDDEIFIPFSELEIENWITFKEFCKEFEIKKKHRDRYKKIFKKLNKEQDLRVKIVNDKLMIDSIKDFSDILE